MKLAEKLAEKAFEVLKDNAVLVSAADYQNNIVTKLQLYFLDDEDTVAMDVIKKVELLESGVEDIFVLNVNAASERDLIQRVGICDIEDQLFIKADFSVLQTSHKQSDQKDHHNGNLIESHGDL